MRQENIDIAFKFVQRPEIPVDPPLIEEEEIPAEVKKEIEGMSNLAMYAIGAAVVSFFFYGLHRWASIYLG